MPTPPPHVRAPIPAALVDEQVARMLRGAIGLRAVVAPMLVVVVAGVAWIDPTPWRRLALIALVGFGIAASLVTEHRVRGGGLARAMVSTNLVGTAAVQLVMVALTGGVDSPLLPVVVPYAILTSLMLGRRPVTYAILTSQVLTLAVLTVLQAGQWAPFLDLHAVYVGSGPRRAVAGGVVMGIVVFGSLMGLTVRRHFEDMVADALRAREEQLATWIEWSRDLETLGGEIAHELKNPLASVKGLAALVGRDLPEGRASERMGVLQGEVERMRDILDEFLTFSRPLSPLSRKDVDPGEVIQRVVALHEGAARAAGVVLVARGQARTTSGDPRKILQILVNLVQNALAASARGDQVEVSVDERAGQLVFDVADQGPGLDPELAERVFHPGVTGRAEGSGLGLTIARAIARQHGGDVELVPRDGGGLVARLVLP